MNKAELCEKIQEIYPDIGRCGIEVEVLGYDESKEAWTVILRRDDRELITHLDPPNARACMEGRECVHLGLQIGQLMDNIEKA
ncbi:MAG: hypothetical protein R6T96_10030 [Longimicrobiales bacterium]